MLTLEDLDHVLRLILVVLGESGAEVRALACQLILIGVKSPYLLYFV